MPILGNPKLEQVIHTNLTDKVRGKGCSAISLIHVDGVESREEIHAIAVAPGGTDAGELADLFQSRAEMHASGSQDRQKFELVFFYESNKPQRPYSFTVFSKISLGEHGAEEATAKGLVKNAMASANEALRMAFAQINAMNAASIDMVEAVTQHARATTEQLKNTSEERDALIDHMMTLRFQSQSKEHEFRLEEIEKIRKNENFRKVMEYLPGLVNQIAKKNVFPESTGDTAILKGLLGSLDKMDPQLVASLIAQLPEQVAGAVMSRAMQLKESEDQRKRDHANALEMASRAVTTPELSATNSATGEKKEGESSK